MPPHPLSEAIDRLQVQRQRDLGGEQLRVVGPHERGHGIDAVEVEEAESDHHQQWNAEEQQQHHQQRADLQVRSERGRELH